MRVRVWWQRGNMIGYTEGDTENKNAVSLSYEGSLAFVFLPEPDCKAFQVDVID